MHKVYQINSHKIHDEVEQVLFLWFIKFKYYGKYSIKNQNDIQDLDEFTLPNRLSNNGVCEFR